MCRHFELVNECNRFFILENISFDNIWSYIRYFPGDHTLIESIAILHYLDEAYPEKHPLLPKDLIKWCKVREISEVIASGIQPVQKTSLLNRLHEHQRKDWPEFWITKGFCAIEKLLTLSAGKFWSRRWNYNGRLLFVTANL